MAYFANASMGDDWEATYCPKCLHQPEPDAMKACPVLLVHELYNYDKPMRPLLNLLIPMEGNYPGECAMFAPKDEFRAAYAEHLESKKQESPETSA